MHQRFGDTASDICRPVERHTHACQPPELFDAPDFGPDFGITEPAALNADLAFSREAFTLMKGTPTEAPRWRTLMAVLGVILLLLFLPLLIAMIGERPER